METKLQNKLQHLYISPLERCNLCCKMCYTNKSSAILTNDAILDFVARYNMVVGLKSITFCGGEVFALDNYPNLVNILTKLGYFIQIITNGTIDKLDEIKDPNSVNIIVSIDGLEKYHDLNRGLGNYKKSLAFLKRAQKLGFHLEIFSIVTQENLSQIPEFEKEIAKQMEENILITYHPRKSMCYLQKHPISNRIGKTQGFSFINDSERKKLAKKKKIFPPLEFGCYQISLMSNGFVYGCCEGITPLGKISDDIKILVEHFKNRLEKNNKCIEPNFKCGLN